MKRGIKANVLERVARNRQRLEDARLREEREREFLRKLNQQQKEQSTRRWSAGLSTILQKR